MRWCVPVLACLFGIAACGGERRVPASDSSQVGRTGDTATAGPMDTAAAMKPDISRAQPSVRDSTTAAARPDTAAQAAHPPAETTAARKPTRKPPAPRADTARAAAAPTRTDTGKADTVSARPESTTQTAEAPLRDVYHPAPKDTVSQQVYDGWKQFNLNCARCHGEDVLGTTIAPHLILSLKPDGPINTKELFMQTVCAGRPEKGMPSWCALGLDMSKIEDIYAYVKGRSDAKIHPGRPAVKPGT